jgi:2-C-methyl-D-erythritol 2,4-cyclodiphosphate synthase
LIRVGIGTDIHRLEEGRDLVIGGIKIPFKKGLSGHSDADVLTHSVIDALFGATSLGDIGQHFPSSDSRWKGISSLILLEKTMKLLERSGFEVKNVDSTILAEKPSLARWIPKMVKRIASILKVQPGCVSVKATTGKGIGEIGAGEAISATTVALVVKVETE